MKALRKTARILSLILVLSMMFALAACSLFGGSLELKSFTVVRSSIKTTYLIGEEIDFSGIKAEVIYTDDTLNKVYTFDDLTIEYPSDITATVGEKEVKVSFLDPNLNVKQETTVKINVQEDPNAPKHKDYVVDSSAMKTTYLIGDTIDFTGVTAKETFTNGGADVALDVTKLEYVYDDNITATAGTKVILVKYDGKDAGAITITVNNPAITSLDLDTTGVTLEYMVGDTVSFDGLKANVTYENGVTSTITTFEFVTNLETLTDEYGTKQVTVKINDTLSATVVNKSFEVKVDGIVDYDVITTEMTLTYLENEDVSFAGIKVTANYYYGSTADVAFEDLTFVHEENISATVGMKNVSVKVGGEVVGSFNVTIGDIPTATANTANVDTSYRVGEIVSLDGLTVTLTFTDGTADQTIALADLTVDTPLEGLTATAGKKTVQVKYLFDEYTIYSTFQITVYGIDSYVIDASAMKTTYIVGDTLDYTGLVVKAHYLDGGEDVVVDASKLSFTDDGITASAGNKTIPVLVDGKSANVAINVTVEKNSIVSAVVGGSFDQSYETDEEVNFTGLTVTVTYKNGDTVTLTLADGLGFSIVDMTTAGEKTVTVSFKDAKNNDEAASATFKINVVNARPTVTRFEKPAQLITFDQNNKNAGGEVAPTDKAFYGKFINGAVYKIGDDNEFKLNPNFSTKLGTATENPKIFYTTVEISINRGSGYNALTKVVNPQKPTESKFYEGETLIATVDTYNGLYQFEAAAVDALVSISVLPSIDYYKYDSLNPVVLEAKIIDAYNVYEAWQLAVVDNNAYRSDWNTFKAEKGLTGIDPAGIVMHNDIHISANDVPQSFLIVSDRDITYLNMTDPENPVPTVAPAGTRYLIDGTDIYSRKGNAEFTIQGNLFTLDATKFPLVPSNEIFAGDTYDYGSDFSNSTLFVFDTNYDRYEEAPADKAINLIENVNFVGNAGRNNFVHDTDQGLASAGGLILVKIRNYAEATFNNTIGNSFFIAYFPDVESIVNMNDIKFYDAYQNAMMLWGDAVCNVNNAYFYGAGGPLVICQSVERDDHTWKHPELNITGEVFTKTQLTGSEIWFTAVNATTIVSDIKAIGAGLQQAGLGNFVGSDGNMNIIGLLMKDGSNAEEIVQGFDAQGSMFIDGAGLSRYHDDPYWSVIHSHPAFLSGAPVFTVYDESGAPQTLYFNGTTFCDIQGRALGTDASHAALVTAFQAADRIVLTQGGLSVLFEFYH